ncbi:hypothetical protein B0T14DRAFT_520490 [Immersiella caudata]|uniref:Uncharacterized protein n=1 Tax=Immersiella caudata TaxID=314043 RepID=A0AA39WR49_9PEZI|nr:hypothetical protein B0T14DRAFT_520490 [Immersiella caudata]
MSAHPHPVFLSPALPTELLWHIVHHCAFPSTLVVCSSRVEFLSAVSRQVKHQKHPHHPARGAEYEEAADEGGQEASVKKEGQLPRPFSTADARAAQLLAAPLYQVAVARHIRVVFIPTVSHLRAYLSVFSVADAKVTAPPSPTHGIGTAPKEPLLLVYGLLDLHRSTSEWSVQGISNTAAAIVETTRRVGFQAVAVEPQTYEEVCMENLLAERMPILSGSARRPGPDLEGSGWTGRTVDVRSVLRRWFRFRHGDWDSQSSEKPTS